jgi:cell division protein FtsI/penicillin-binding protein 2
MSRRAANTKKSSTQTIFTRFMFIVALFGVWIAVISVRLVYLQVNQSDWLSDRAQNQRRDERKSKMLRGSILDNSGRALALSVKVRSLYADPREIEDVNATAQKVGAALKIKPQQIASDIQEAKKNNKRFIWLARKIDEDKAQKLNDALKDEKLKKFDEPKIAGLHWKEEQKRSYPYGSLAAQVVGFSDLDDIGRAGIELSQEKALRGAVVEGWRDRDRLGRVYDEEEEEREPPKDVVLTISNSIQYKVEQALKEGVEAANAKSGMAVVIDPKTGEILAMANYPTFDPNKFNEAAPENYANRAIQSLYAPGSVFKLVTYSSAMQENLISPTGEVECGNGSINVAGHVFRDSHCHKGLSYTDAFAVSSNIGAIRTGMRLGKDKFYNYARNFGFGEPTGVELPAEIRGQFRSPERWNGDSLASMSIGYEMGVTALQSASAFATIANDGLRIKPHIIKEIRASDGTVISKTEPEKAQVVSAETARNLRRMMRQVVLSGTGKRAQLNGYSSAGKTGTAWKFDAKLKKVSSSKYVSSFIGLAPVENPSVVIAVVLDEPTGGARDGGQVSAPIFRNIAEQILPEMNVIPDGTLRQTGGEEIKEVEAVNDVFDANADEEDVLAEKTEKKPAVAENKKKPESESKKTPTEKSDKPKDVVADDKSKKDAKNKSSGERTKSKT